MTSAPSFRSLAPAWLLALGIVGASPALAQSAGSNRASAKPAEQSLEQGNRGHGSFTLGYTNTYSDGFNDAILGGNFDIGTVRVQSAFVSLEYYLSDRWAVYFSVPFVEAKYRGEVPFCPTVRPPVCVAGAPYTLTEPHPESQFLDDGAYHGTWQDFTFGFSYHHVIDGSYFLTPTMLATIPSHDYVFYANAAPGKNLQRVELSLELAHQLELSNWYYRVNGGYVFVEKTLGQSIDYAKLDLEFGRFFNERFIGKVFVAGKKGDGWESLENTSEQLYHVIQRTRHNYANAGAGIDYRFSDKYTLSGTVQTLVWGEDVFDFKYSLDIRLTRDF